jgi:hypothetical protein
VQLVSQTDLIARCRVEADMEGSEFISDAQIGNWLTSSARRLYNLLLRHKGVEYYARRSTINTSAGVAEYNLPSDFYQLLGIRLVASSSDQYPLEPFSIQQIGELNSSGAYGTDRPSHYRTKGMFAIDGSTTPTEVVELLPAPKGTYRVELDYVPAFQIVSSGTVFYNGINGWEEFMVYDVAARMLAKQESDPNFCLGQLARLEDEIKALSAKRDRRPAVMVDVYNDLGRCGPWGRRGWP